MARKWRQIAEGPGNLLYYFFATSLRRAQKMGRVRLESPQRLLLDLRNVAR